MAKITTARLIAELKEAEEDKTGGYGIVVLTVTGGEIALVLRALEALQDSDRRRRRRRLAGRSVASTMLDRIGIKT